MPGWSSFFNKEFSTLVQRLSLPNQTKAGASLRHPHSCAKAHGVAHLGTVVRRVSDLLILEAGVERPPVAALAAGAGVRGLVARSGADTQLLTVEEVVDVVVAVPAWYPVVGRGGRGAGGGCEEEDYDDGRRVGGGHLVVASLLLLLC